MTILATEAQRHREGKNRTPKTQGDDPTHPSGQLSVDKDPLTGGIIGCAIEVHRHLGPGLLEAVYEEALAAEFEIRGLRFLRQVTFPVVYKGKEIGEYRLDFLVEDAVVVEIKSVDRHDPVFEAQVLTYPRATGKRVGLLINFNTRFVVAGIKRLVL